MAWSLVKNLGTNATTGTGVTTLGITIPAGGVPAGNFVVLTSTHNNGTAPTGVTDNKGNTYFREVGAPNGTSVYSGVYVGRLTTALVAGDIVTITYPTARHAAISAAEFAGGLVSGTVPDQFATATGTATTSVTVGPTPAQAAANNLSIANYAASNDRTFSSSSSGHLALSKSVSTTTIRANVPVYRVIAGGAGATETAVITYTTTGTSTGAYALITLKEQPTATGNALAGTDAGGSTDTGAIKVEKRLSGTDAGGSTDAGALSDSVIPTLANLDLWYRADKLATGNGASVVNWPQSGGNGGTATGSATYHTNQANGKPILRFDGSTNAFDLATSRPMATFTMFAVVKRNVAQYGVFLGGPTNAAQWRIDPNAKQQLIKAVVAEVGTSTTALSSSAFEVISVTFTDGVGGTFRRNGVADGSISATNFTANVTTIGRHGESFRNEYFSGDIAEIGGYTRVLSNNELTAVENDLAGRYGVTFTLPNNALTGSETGGSTDSGSLTLDKKLSGSDAGTSTDSGSLFKSVSLQGTDSGTGLDSGSLLVTRRLSGTDAGTSTDSGTLELLKRLSGTDAGGSTDTGNITQTGTNYLAGTDAGTSADNGAVRIERYLFGTDAGGSTDSGAIRIILNLLGLDAAASTDTGAITLTKRLSGTDAGGSTDTGALTQTGNNTLAGTDAGSSTDTGSLYVLKFLQGAETSASTDSGTLKLLTQLAGLDAGGSADTGALLIILPPLELSGVDVGSSSDYGTLTIIGFIPLVRLPMTGTALLPGSAGAALSRPTIDGSNLSSSLAPSIELNREVIE